MRARLRGATIDVSALRAPGPFRRMFVAQLVSGIGSEVTLFALFVQVWILTESAALVGLVGAFQAVPTIACALWGGAIADSMDRRRLLVLVQAGLLVVSGALAGVALLDAPPLALIYALAALSAGLSAIDGPARSAVMPMLVEAPQLRSAVQLREVVTQSGRLLGPAIGGGLIALAGLPSAYALDALSFAIAFVLFLGLPSLVPRDRRAASLGSVLEAVRFVRSRPVLAASFWADLGAMVLGMPRALFPAVAFTVYGVGEVGAGLLASAIAAGAVMGLGFSGLTGRVRREGLAVVVAIAVWGVAIALFAVAPWFWLALVLLAIAGAADMVSALFRQTILLQIVPDNLRGRMSAVHILIVKGGPPVGDLRAGGLGEVIGVRPSALVGGLACIASMGLLAARIPEFVRWRSPALEPDA